MKRDIPLGHRLRHHLRQCRDAVITEVLRRRSDRQWATHGRDRRHTQTHRFRGIGFLAVCPEERIIITLAPARSQQSYRHEAFLWHDAYDFTAGIVPFITDGLEAGEPVMVAVSTQHTKWLRDALDGQADVEFVDIEQLGRNPAQIIPAWQQFLNSRSGRFRPVRGVGEPIWPGRRPEELVECQLHEAMLNIAIDPETPFWLICSYDTVTLSPAVVEEAHRSHPVIVEAASYQGSAHYTGRAHVEEMFAAELSELVGRPIAAVFTAHNVSRLYAYIKLELYIAGLSAGAAGDLAATAQQLALNSLQRGAAEVTVQMWSQPHALICDVVDDTVIDDVLLGRRVPVEDEHDGLWDANQLCDLVQMRSSSVGTTVRLHAWK